MNKVLLRNLIYCKLGPRGCFKVNVLGLGGVQLQVTTSFTTVSSKLPNLTCRPFVAGVIWTSSKLHSATPYFVDQRAASVLCDILF